VQQGLRRFGSHLSALVTSARASGANVLLIKEPTRAEAFLREPMHGVIDEVGRTLGVEVLMSSPLSPSDSARAGSWTGFIPPRPGTS
jgi:hypothetical protein